MLAFGKQLLSRTCRTTVRRSVPVLARNRFATQHSVRFLSSEQPSDSGESQFKAFNPDELEGDSASVRLRRALLYVPGNDQRKIDKVKSILGSVDSIVLDCEDGVAVNKKEEARHTILKTLEQLKSEPDQSLVERVSVRVNSIDSGLAEEDLKIVLSGPVIPRTILLPKVESKAAIDQFLEYLQLAFQSRPAPVSEDKSKKSKKVDPLEDIDTLDLIIYVESAKGLLELKDICAHSVEMAEFTKCRLAGVVFGSDDFYADIGATRSDDHREVLLARQQVVLTAKAFNLQAIDCVYINYKDLEGLKRSAEEGAAMGFTGKQAIHPSQVEVIQDAFRPTDVKIKWAKGLVSEFEKAQKEGKGAFVYEGQMIDMPLLKQAYNVLRFAQKIGKA